METSQRHAEPYFPPWTERWPRRRQLGFGVLAAIPPVLLAAAFLAWFASSAMLPVLVYVHVGAQFITLLLFGHLMIGNPRLSSSTKAAWSVGFLFLAPLAIPLYWAMHVWDAGEEARTPAELQRRPPERQVHVYDYDYTQPEARESERRDDGSILHHVGPERT